MPDKINVEQQYKETQTQLKEIGDQLKQFGEDSQNAVKQHKQLSEESKAKVDELLMKQGELNARLQAAEQALADNRGGDNVTNPVTMGQQVVKNDAFADLSKLAKAKGSVGFDIKSAITTPDTPDRFVQPQRVPGVVTPPQQRLFIRDLLMPGTTQSNSIEYIKESGFTNNAAPVSENPAGGKPESDITFSLEAAPVATIAHWIQASKQILSDSGMLQSYIDGRLRYGLMLKEEAQLLKGSGAGLNINGLYTQASSYVNPGVTVDGETQIDRLRLAMLQVQLAEYASDGIVLNPIDWTAIELLKDTQLRYLFVSPQGSTVPTLWGLPVSATQSLDQDEYLVGSFQMGAQLHDREETNVMISTEDRDNFIKNMVTILCEERVGLTVYRPEAFVKGLLSAT